MKEQAIKTLRAKGINNPEGVIDELVRSGALSHYALSKYVAREMWVERLAKFPDRTPTDIAKDVAEECRISFTTLRRVL